MDQDLMSTAPDVEMTVFLKLLREPRLGRFQPGKPEPNLGKSPISVVDLTAYGRLRRRKTLIKAVVANESQTFDIRAGLWTLLFFLDLGSHGADC